MIFINCVPGASKSFLTRLIYLCNNSCNTLPTVSAFGNCHSAFEGMTFLDTHVPFCGVDQMVDFIINHGEYFNTTLQIPQINVIPTSDKEFRDVGFYLFTKTLIEMWGDPDWDTTRIDWTWFCENYLKLTSYPTPINAPKIMVDQYIEYRTIQFCKDTNPNVVLGGLTLSLSDIHNQNGQLLEKLSSYLQIKIPDVAVDFLKLYRNHQLHYDGVFANRSLEYIADWNKLLSR